jgi:hypothetical protein
LHTLIDMMTRETAIKQKLSEWESPNSIEAIYQLVNDCLANG